MVSKTVTVVVDDLDDQLLPTDTKPVKLALGRDAWVLHLSDENLQELCARIAPFVQTADRITGERPPSAQRTDPSTIRKWARRQGHLVPASSPVPSGIVRAYEAATRQ